MKRPEDTIALIAVSSVSPRTTVVNQNGQKVKSILSQKENRWYRLWRLMSSLVPRERIDAARKLGNPTRKRGKWV